MRWATFRYEGMRLVGSVEDDCVRPVGLPQDEAERGVLALIERLAHGDETVRASADTLALAEVQLEAPLPHPRRGLFCVGRNYHAHACEQRATVFKDSPKDTQAWPIVFTKLPECVVGPDAPVLLPAAVSTQIDYEAELAVVIGRGGRNIARDVQMRRQQWDLGKSFDGFCPMGPWITGADEFDGTDTRVRCWVNDELRQDARTADQIFDIPTLIETCSRGITLRPGDVIATGTPAGVGMAQEPPRWLRHGDVVRIEIDGIGILVNRFVEEGR